MAWEGECAKVQILVKEKDNWKVLYNNEEVWVLRKRITDLRPVILEASKSLFQIKSLKFIWIEYRKGLSILYRLSVFEPLHFDPPDEIRRQLRRLYIFQQIMGATAKKFIFHRENYVPTVYGIDYTFDGDVSLPASVVKKWFDLDDVHTLIRNFSYKGRTFSSSIDLFEQDLLEIIKKIDKEYVWYASDVINRQIMDIV